MRILLDVSTPVVVLVLGGDIFTLRKVAEAINMEISVVIVNGSGKIATMLASVFKQLEDINPRLVKSQLF